MVKNMKKRKPLNPYSIYVLLLEDNYFYVGITRNLKQRYGKHCEGTGARWTQIHKPVGVIEIRDTPIVKTPSAARLEDEVTLEYAEIYGYNNVRGGGYCQQFPRWPK